MPQLKLDQGPGAEIADSRWKSLYRVGGAAALIVAVLFLIAISDLITADIQTGTIFQNNFLVLIFKLHAGFSGVQEESLEGRNLLDMTIVALVGTMSLALYPALKRVNKDWAIVATSLPFIGLALFIITHEIGRSGIIAAGLINAVIMLRSDIFSKRTAFVGILANVFLLVGDVGTAFSYSNIFAISMSIGYALFLIWCILIGRRLFHLGQGISKEDVNRIGGISQ
jgi:hypothetical protein